MEEPLLFQKHVQGKWRRAGLAVKERGVETSSKPRTQVRIAGLGLVGQLWDTNARSKIASFATNQNASAATSRLKF